MPDRDEFTKAPSRLRRAFLPLLGAAQGAPVGASSPAKALNSLFRGGVPSLAPLLGTLRATAGSADTFELVESAVRPHATGKLDLVLERAAQRILLDQEFSPERLVRRFVREAIDFAIIHSKGGVLEHVREADLDHVHAVLAPAAEAAVQRLISNPLLKRLGLPVPKDRVDPHGALPLLLEVRT